MDEQDNTDDRELELGQLVTGPSGKDYKISGILDGFNDDSVEVEDYTEEKVNILSRRALLEDAGDWKAHFHNNGSPVIVEKFAGRKAVTEDKTMDEQDNNPSGGEYYAERYPDVADTARQISKSHADAGIGVQKDTLVEAAIEVKDAQVRVADIHVTLDGVCDNQGLIPNPVQSDLREMQQEAQAVAIWLDDFQEALRQEANEVGSNE